MLYSVTQTTDIYNQYYILTEDYIYFIIASNARCAINRMKTLLKLDNAKHKTHTHTLIRTRTNLNDFRNHKNFSNKLEQQKKATSTLTNTRYIFFP